MIYTDVGCCCSLFDVVSSVVFSFVSRYRSKLSVFFFFFFFFFLLPLSLYPHSPFSLSLFPFFVDFPHNLFFLFFLLFFFIYIYIFIFYFYFFLSSFSLLFSLSPGLCSVTVVVEVKGYITLKLLNYSKEQQTPTHKPDKNTACACCSSIQASVLSMCSLCS